MPPYPEKLEITPLSRPPSATVRVPGSKSITNRALVLGALYAWDASCRILGALRSEDTEVMVAALQALGYTVEPHWEANTPFVEVGPVEAFAKGDPDLAAWPPRSANLFVANSGTSMRFLAALVSLGKGRYRLDGVPRMRERPIQPLLDALQIAGVRAFSENGDGCPPIVIEGAGGWTTERIRVRGDGSSQFLSALLMAAPLACRRKELHIEVDGPLVSQPYIDMTVRMMETWSLPIWRQAGGFRVRHAGAEGWMYDGASYTVEPDASGASYFFAAAAILRGEAVVPGLSSDSLQGDVRFVDFLERMGCGVERHRMSIIVRGASLHGIDADMNDISDTVMTLAAVACFAEGPTTIRNVAHIRHKETDRLAALATELRRVGAEVEEFADGLTITPRPLHGAEIETYNDHRMAMSMALIGLKVPGIVIKNPGCVAKTYPGFFADLEKLR
ncbi:MAG TPA: 3-phosphoshikimate 1-carboxyvinyltransferase [Gemmataceae bacterium]|nr:3-phosphoshikimate 1-carboxyvinyltransferase [Gemmataceae bacterium]